MKTISAENLIGHLTGIPIGERRTVAIAGPPGSGKSTLAGGIDRALNAKSPGYAGVVPMDGFHFDDEILVRRGIRHLKGAPETFDSDGFLHMLKRLRSNDAEEVAVPVFDRGLEISRGGARIIPRSIRAVIVEGSYLLLDQDRWNQLRFRYVGYDRSAARDPEAQVGWAMARTRQDRTRDRCAS
ncbi:nucleoside triphosphate hydrolase [Pararhizobium sp.]|uniref:nucleoside triphosphate hydrolase n=1 Tax=Pararhizobium sp. TaxID=1977563 RepID=UPI003D0FE153